MLAHDLFAGVTLKALGASIPTAHPSLWIKHVNGIIGYTLNQAPEPLLASAKFLFRSPSFREVSRDLGKSY